METFLQDLKHSLRLFRQSPVLRWPRWLRWRWELEPIPPFFPWWIRSCCGLPPFPKPDRLVFFMNTSPGGSGSAGSPAKFQHWRAQASVVEDVAAFRTGVVNLTGNGLPEQIRSAQVSEAYFRLFGAPIIRGHTFSRSRICHMARRSR